MNHHHHGPDLLPLLAVAALAAGYVVLAARDPRGWSRWRTASFLAGCALLAVALVPGWSRYPAGGFAAHMEQHLLLGMYAPLGLVLGAPVTLLLRALPVGAARTLTRVLRWPVVRVLVDPVAGLVLTVGAMAVLYATPLYAAAADHPTLHHLLHLHFVLSGCLFTAAIAGPDPAPHRPSVPYRLVVLGVAIAVHATLAQLLYGGFVAPPVPAADRRAGADLMYYGGDLAELALALALVTTWRPARTRRPSVAAVTG